MYPTNIYVKRREQLRKKIKSGVLLFLGNSDAPMNYKDNIYPFRQDSTFLYYFGINHPDFTAVIDIDENKEIIFANDLSVDDIVWTGPQKSTCQLAKRAGLKNSAPINKLIPVIKKAIAGNRMIHYLPQYRSENKISLSKLLEINPSAINNYASHELTTTVISQRSIKSKEEVADIEKAINVSYEMYTTAMKIVKPGMYEREIAGFVEGIVLSAGGRLSFPTILSVHGETLHNHYHTNKMKSGDIFVMDSGAEVSNGYASDITRTIPVNGKFSNMQKDIYEIVLDAQVSSIKAIKPGVKYKTVHLKAAKIITQGLKDLGLVKGNVSDAVANGAHAMFFPHGLGHMMGLDVHDMENLGEQFVGYSKDDIRSEQFGLAYLRLARELKSGFVLTVEPGIYFIPALIDKWRKEKINSRFINFEKVNKYRQFGGVRIEDDILVTNNGYRILGKPIPKTIKDVEAYCSK
ncbi:MAG: Xaa-Pro aminopeptidase [Ignavibacteriales bacterium CG_4_9_14_3_um_filter_30_11]|nr:MAG: Xaa-Pro aminopeptidase [Ignavibacteriales bacterium CG_4_9_14_3_um_filter_30_11]